MSSRISHLSREHRPNTSDNPEWSGLGRGSPEDGGSPDGYAIQPWEVKPRVSKSELGKGRGGVLPEDEIVCSKGGRGIVYSVWLEHREQVRNDNGEMGRVLSA